MQIHLIRHTTPDIEPGICYGQADIGLAGTFEQEKNAILKLLLADYDAVYSSPLSRCCQLAEHIKSAQHNIDDNLMEYNFGDWELQPWSQLYNQESQAWFDDHINVAAPNGESLQQMQQRVTIFINQLLNKNQKSVAVVTHAGVQRLIWAWLLDIPLNNIFRIEVKYGDVFELNYDTDRHTGKIRRL